LTGVVSNDKSVSSLVLAYQYWLGQGMR
jgi:hypothetical protein